MDRQTERPVELLVAAKTIANANYPVQKHTDTSKQIFTISVYNGYIKSVKSRLELLGIFFWLSVFTCVLHVCGGIGVSHGINIDKLLLKHRQQEGEAIIQTNVQDELMKSRVWLSYSCKKLTLTQ